MGIESGLLEKFVTGAVKGKRVIGHRALKPNLRNREGQGWIELMFNPRNGVERALGEVLKFSAPYLAFITYRFHVEKCNDYGMRVEDYYNHKFFKEEHALLHVYAQNFHPHTLLERVRLVGFNRRARTIFKGVTCPDWAKAKNQEGGWEFDIHSRSAWHEAMHEFHSEWTPMQYSPAGRPSNPLNWFRFDHALSGHSSRLFYNEVPEQSWRLHGGHQESQDFYSFTYADQVQKLRFGLDTTTEEGREKYKEMYEFFEALTPEMFKGHEMVYPHEKLPEPPNEAHYLRMWGFYRQYALEQNLNNAIAAEAIEQSTVDEHNALIAEHGGDLANVLVQLQNGKGKLDHIKQDPRWASTEKVLQLLGLDNFKLDLLTAKPHQDQFYYHYDQALVLTPAEMEQQVEFIVADEAKRAQLEAGSGQQKLEGDSQERIE